MEGDKKLFFRFSKIKNNRLLHRCQMVVDVYHSKERKVTKESMREYIRTHFKKQHVSLFGVKKFFGGGRTQGYALIYDNEDSMKKYEPSSRMKRVETEKLPPKDRKKTRGKKDGRKTLKIKKHQQQKKWGTKGKQEKKLSQKQKKKAKK